MIVTYHKGLLEVYLVALRATPFAVFQLPSWLMLPLIRTFSPYVVVSSSLKVTAIDVGVAQALGDVLVLLMDEVLLVDKMVPLGKAVLVAVLHVPLAEEPEQLNGSLAYEPLDGLCKSHKTPLHTKVAPQDAGTIAFRAALAVRKAA